MALGGGAFCGATSDYARDESSEWARVAVGVRCFGGQLLRRRAHLEAPMATLAAVVCMTWWRLGASVHGAHGAIEVAHGSVGISGGSTTISWRGGSVVVARQQVQSTAAW